VVSWLYYSTAFASATVRGRKLFSDGFSMLSKRVKQNILKETRAHETDTGSAPAQIGLLSRRIDELAKHLKKYSKDNHSRRGLLKMVMQRRKLLAYLLKNNPKKHASVTKKLGLKK
jgi:small subunit ribosomal protein S15